MNRRSFKGILFLLLLCISLLPLLAMAQEHIVRVVGVSDGDTITILDDRKQQIKVRLAEIDTPEPAQPYGARVPSRNYRDSSLEERLVSRYRIRMLWA